MQINSLEKLSYLNLSSNKITDVGLTYLHFLTNLKELVLLNMCNLSEDYFLSLQKNSFINRMRSLECDKKYYQLNMYPTIIIISFFLI